MKRRLITYMALPVVWCMVSGEVTIGNLFLGLVFGMVVVQPFSKLYRMDEVVVPTGNWVAKIPKKIKYFYVLIKEIIKANIVVAKIVLSPKIDIKPGIIAVPIRAKTNIGITGIANTITLTPGTLTVDISDDKTILYVHSIDATNPQGVRDSIRDDLEHYILEAFE
ncbi:Na+/H+ antiporter subunit E [Methanosarcina sp.]|uniref:Na+/H+ antiporter subunit E n=1 Tax=Methanosarcina sp. TaxID=2213 RepID=UPI002AB8C48D|nr:Na+/H+ antiporter subunit E [Methanosarcina sp.]MDY9927673.1 Na+/H+ antiporter subunit E [Methanosarcina sp.]